MFRTLLCSTFLGMLPALTLAAQPPSRRPLPGAPLLVVMITVDQLRPDYLTMYQPQFTGGLARLMKGGALFTNAFQDHAITETAPGHSTTLSGRFPRSTGIVSNSAGVGDPQAPLIGAPGEGASPFRFRGSTLADWLRFANPASRALSISRKDRGAILPLGRAKQSVFWYAANGTFTTSRYYADTLPAWLQQFNAQRFPERWTGKSWDLLLPESAYAEADSVAAENGGQGVTFPHLFPTAPAQVSASFSNYPMMDELTLAVALEGVRQMSLGTGPATDLLAVSLSTTDAIGHRFGPDAREVHDQVVRLDRYLGVFLDSLFAMRDSSRVIVALTADHSVGPLPEATSRYPNKGAGRVALAPIWAEFRAGLISAGVDSTGIAFDEGVLYLYPAALAPANMKADAVARAFATRLSVAPGVLRVDLMRHLVRSDTTRDYVARRWLHMLPPDLPAAATVTLKPYWYQSGVSYPTHGSPHDYDAQVPIILWGPRVRPGTYGELARVVDIAPTLAELLGIEPTEKLDGHVLRAALRR
jgi:predicted AlkP superfamily pyrophosphatase or phosphodiesterase